jgi:hypothetical protein
MRYLMVFCLTAFVGIASCGVKGTTHEPPRVELKFDRDRATVDEDTWALNDGPMVLKCVKKGTPEHRPKFVQDDRFGKALQIKLTPTSGLGTDNGRDKINYTVLKGNDPNAPAFDGRMTYYKFAVKLDPHEFETPTTGKDYLIAQWWQGAPFGPPLSLEILNGSSPTDNPQIMFAIRNQKTGANPSAKVIYVEPKTVKELVRGRWYVFVVGVQFGFSDDAKLKVWIDNDDSPEISWHGNIGYDPSLSALDLGFKTGKVDRQPNPGIELYFGPYRDRQASTQVFYFADISYGTSKPRASD